MGEKQYCTHTLLISPSSFYARHVLLLMYTASTLLCFPYNTLYIILPKGIEAHTDNVFLTVYEHITISLIEKITNLLQSTNFIGLLLDGG